MSGASLGHLARPSVSIASTRRAMAASTTSASASLELSGSRQFPRQRRQHLPQGHLAP